MGEQAVRPRHVPQRTCIGCGAEGPKGKLARLVRTPQGRAKLDLTGKEAGRGAYVCASASCWEMALKGKRLEHALRTKLSLEEKATLLGTARELFPS